MPDSDKSAADLKRRVGDIRPWRSGSERAPHKPLLLLLQLGRVQRGLPRLTRFTDIEHQLRDLLRRFGPARGTYHAEYPFWRAQNDGIWEVRGTAPFISRKSNTDPPISDLRAKNAEGGFPEVHHTALVAHPRLLRELARDILAAHFAPPVHAAILDAVGLDLSSPDELVIEPPLALARAVFSAYDGRCAVCRYDGRFGGKEIGLHAAHIQWPQCRGPHELANALCLCGLHNDIFYGGAISIDANYHLLVAPEFTGGGTAFDTIDRYGGRRIQLPARDADRPALKYLEWHRGNVFGGAARASV